MLSIVVLLFIVFMIGVLTFLFIGKIFSFSKVGEYFINKFIYIMGGSNSETKRRIRH